MNADPERSWRIGIDTGGTFTDLVAVSATGETLLRKVSSTPSMPSKAVFEALGRTGLPLHEVLNRFILGTTIATNAVIQRAGATTILFTTAGFEDVLYIQRIDRPEVYDLQWVKTRPFALRRHTIGVPERVMADGSVRRPLDGQNIERAVAQARPLIAQHPDAAIAICLLFSYLNPAHEQALAAALRTAFPGIAVSLSSTVAPVWREYERASTTVMDAYVHGVVRAFSEDLVEGLDALKAQERTALMKSNGGQVPIAHAADRPSDMILSGLAGGMIAGHFWSQRVGTPKAVTLDMGGTSADVGVVVDGQLQFSGRYDVEWGIPITVPIIDVTTIGAGGSSIATIDYGGLLRVGPESAGAEPGPACYGKGGTAPTITDANVVLGRLDPSFFLGGELLLNADLAAEAVATVAEPLGLSLEAAAEAIIAVAVENMAGAVRLVTVDRGHDYRDFDLIAFGGAGPLHAAQIANSMGMRRAVIPPAPGLVSAFGAVIADERLDRRTTLVRRLDRDTDEIATTLSALARSMIGELAVQTGRSHDSIIVNTFVSCRYVGQNYEQEIRTYRGHVDQTFELAVSLDPQRDDFLTTLAAAFHRTHEASYGYSMQDQAIESVYLGATAMIPGTPVPLQPYHGGGERRSRRICGDGGTWQEAEIVDRSLLVPGDVLEGPAVIVEPTSTTYVPEQFRAELDRDHCLLLRKGHQAGTGPARDHGGDA